MQSFTALLLSVLALAISTTAKPLHVAAERSIGKVLDDLNIPVTQPGGGEVYDIGSTQTCCWLTDNIPVTDEDETASLVLGHFDGSGTPKHDWSHPLYSGFPQIAGCVNWVVPNVNTGDLGDPFFVVLWRGNVEGDSVSNSGNFRIQPAGS